MPQTGHSLQAEKHDAFRGISGCWESAIAGMSCCLEQGLPVIVQTTLMSWNYQEVPALIEFAQDLGVTAFNLYYLVCTGRGQQLADISPRQYEESMASLVDAQALHPSLMVRAKCAPQVARIARQRGLPAVGGGCPAGTRYLRIDTEGQITPCPYLPLVAGNIRVTLLKDIWEKAVVFTKLRSPHLRGRCGACDSQETCTGCRARAFALTGDYLGEDPWCLYQSCPSSIASLAQVTWTEEAQSRLQRVPAFVRSRVEIAVEGYARDRGHSVVTADLMAEVRSFVGGKIHRGH